MVDMEYRRRLRGVASGVLGSVVLLAYFVLPYLVDLSRRACIDILICPSRVSDGVYNVLAVAAAISLIAGFLIRREIDKHADPKMPAVAAVIVFHLLFFGIVLWAMLSAAFW